MIIVIKKNIFYILIITILFLIKKNLEKFNNIYSFYFMYNMNSNIKIFINKMFKLV